MVRTKKIFIATESREVKVIRSVRGTFARSFCKECGREVFMAGIDSTVIGLGSRMKELLGGVAAGEIHSNEIGGALMLCIDALGTFMNGGKDENEI
jgi:hypothetical protein